jgi:hypothetical protein
MWEFPVAHGGAKGGDWDTQHCSDEPRRRPLDVATPLEEGHVLVQLLFAHPTERPQEVPQPRPQALLRGDLGRRAGDRRPAARVGDRLS